MGGSTGVSSRALTCVHLITRGPTTFFDRGLARLMFSNERKTEHLYNLTVTVLTKTSPVQVVIYSHPRGGLRQEDSQGKLSQPLGSTFN